MVQLQHRKGGIKLKNKMLTRAIAAFLMLSSIYTFVVAEEPEDNTKSEQLNNQPEEVVETQQIDEETQIKEELSEFLGYFFQIMV